MMEHNVDWPRRRNKLAPRFWCGIFPSRRNTAKFEIYSSGYWSYLLGVLVLDILFLILDSQGLWRAAFSEDSQEGHHWRGGAPWLWIR